MCAFYRLCALSLYLFFSLSLPTFRLCPFSSLVSLRKSRLSFSTEGRSLVQSLSPCKQVLDDGQQQTLRHVTGNLHLAQKNETT